MVEGERHWNLSAAELRHRRQAKFLSQAELAKRAGLNKDTVGYLERGERTARSLTVTKLAAALDCNPEDLLEQQG
jgi:transcriptional regulator with XRE-family HTH domain